jgi:hypothetical protein
MMAFVPTVSTVLALAPDPGEVRRRTAEVFRGAEYVRERSWLQRLLERFFKNFRPPSAGSAVGDVVTTVFGVVACLLVAVIVWYVVRHWVSRARVAADAEPEIDTEVVRSTAEWRTEAERYEAAGEWKLALRARFRELCGELVDRGVLSAVPGRTTGEFRAEVAGALPEAERSFGAAALLFELAWYADAPTGPDENAAFKSHAAQVLVVRPSRRPSPEPVVAQQSGSAQ